MNGNSNGNGSSNGSVYKSMNSQMPQMPQSWSDLTIMTPMDPRSIISSATFQAQAATFLRSSTFLHTTTWGNAPMVVNSSIAGTVMAADPADYDSQVQANTWNGLHQMTCMNNQLPLSVQKIVFLKAGTNFVNNIYLDWTGGASSTSDIELSLRDNSSTSGIFTNAGTGTVPVFSFPATTYSGVGKLFTVTLTRTGRFNVVLRLIDSGGNYSMFEMDWVVL